MSREALQPALDALSALVGRTVHVSIENKQATMGAYMQFSGVLGQPELEGSRVWVPVTYPVSTGDRTGFSVAFDSCEFGGYVGPPGAPPLQLRITADGMRIHIFPR
jgi:hypothetical protein